MDYLQNIENSNIFSQNPIIGMVATVALPIERTATTSRNPSMVLASNVNLPTKRSLIGEDNDVEVLVAPPQKKDRKQAKLKEPKIEDEDSKRNWLDSKVETLIQLRGEMQPEFLKNAKKQGVNMWLNLHSRLLCLLKKFKKTPKACKNRFGDVLKAYKEDNQANNISGEARHTCKFYDSMDTWYHSNGAVVKQISVSTSDMDSEQDTRELKEEKEEKVPSSSKKESKDPVVLGPSTLTPKIKHQEKALELISQLVDISKNMAHSMEVANEFMGNLDKHMEKLIEKL